MSEKKAIKMLCRIMDEESDWTYEAVESLEMAVDALQNQMRAKKLRRFFLCFVCAFSFFAGLVCFACVEGGSKTGAFLGLAFLVISVIAGGVCDADRKE